MAYKKSGHNYKVGSKGEMHIRKELLEALGIGPGWIALQRVVDNKLEVEFLPPEHRESLAGSLPKPDNVPGIPADADWGKIREEAWTRRAEQKMGLREMEI